MAFRQRDRDPLPLGVVSHLGAVPDELGAVNSIELQLVSKFFLVIVGPDEVILLIGGKNMNAVKPPTNTTKNAMMLTGQRLDARRGWPAMEGS